MDKLEKDFKGTFLRREQDPFHKDVNGAPYKIEGKEVGYPGGRIFDPFGMASTPEASPPSPSSLPSAPPTHPQSQHCC